MPVSVRRDYYKILGVSRDVGAREIKKRYRELAREHHPDTNQGSKKAEDRFKLIAEAYEVLSDKKKRTEYDRNRQHAGNRSRARASDPAGDWTGYGYGEQHTRSEYREDPFSRTATEEPPPPDPNAPTRGFDLQFMMDVPFVTVMLGGTLPYTYEKYFKCPVCDGFGTNGSEECSECQGKKLIVKETTVDVNVPPGVGEGFVLRIENQGGEGKNGGPPGDLFLKICTQPHPRFKRKKQDVYAEVPISPHLAEKGGELEVELLNSKTTIAVEEGTLTGEEYRIPGEGAAILWGKKRGDFVIKFLIEET